MAPRNWGVRGAAAWTLLAAGCTTVEIGENDAFDAKRTVSEHLLRKLGVTRRTQFVSSPEGITLSTWHLTQDGARGTVLYFGGNGYLMVNAHDILEGILQAPVDMLSFDYRGFGESEGKPSVDGLKKDALVVYDHLRDVLQVAPDAIVLHGQSLGSFVALWVASQRPVAGVVLETPVTGVRDLLSHLAPWWTRAFIRFDVDAALLREDNLERVRQLSVPLLIIAGGEDPIAHPDMARRLFERAPGPGKTLEVLPGGKHNDLPPRPDYRDAYRQFLTKVLAER